MSELLNDTVLVTVQDASVITVPIDATLSNNGEAADAKAVGDALALKADISQITGIKVNGESADAQGNILIDGADIKVDGAAQTPVTIRAALEALDAKTAEAIVYRTPGEGEVPESVADHVDGVVAQVAGMISQIGTIVVGTNAESMKVPSGGWHVKSSAELSAGTWMITGGMQFPAFSEVAACSLALGDSEINGATARGTGNTTKAFSVSTILVLAEDSIINLRATQSSGSDQTITRLTLRAVQIA